LKTILALLLVLAIGIAIGWHARGGEVELWKTKYKTAKAEAAKAAEVIKPVPVKFNQTGGTVFDFSDVVQADGSVASTSTKTLAVDIVNEGDKPVTLKITLVNPETGEKGLPPQLQNSKVVVFFKSGDRMRYLYVDNKFIADGFEITLNIGEGISGVVGMTLMEAPAGTFADAQNYTMTLYVAQPNYVEKVTYTVKT